MEGGCWSQIRLDYKLRSKIRLEYKVKKKEGGRGGAVEGGGHFEQQ